MALIDEYPNPNSGRMIKEDSSIVNVADKIEAMEGDVGDLQTAIGAVADAAAEEVAADKSLMSYIKGIVTMIGKVAADMVDAGAVGSIAAKLRRLTHTLGQIDDNTVDAGANGTVSAKLKRTTATLGQTDDAVVAAGAAGSLSAKLRRLTMDLGAALTALTAGTAKVQVSGSFATLRPMLGATKTASGVASEVFAGAGRLAGRRGISIKNEHPYLRLRIDGAAVTDTTGIALEPFAQAVFALDPAADVPVYVISEAGLVKYGVVEW